MGVCRVLEWDRNANMTTMQYFYPSLVLFCLLDQHGMKTKLLVLLLFLSAWML